MKIIVVTVTVLAAAYGFGDVATRAKADYDSLSKTGTAVIASDKLVQSWGNQETLDICLSNAWDASAIAKALEGKKFGPACTKLTPQVPVAERAAWALTVGKGLNKAAGISIAAGIPKDVAPDGTFDELFNLPEDGSCAKINKEVGTVEYVRSKQLELKKMVVFSDLGVGGCVEWLLLGGTAKAAAQVAQVKKQVLSYAEVAGKRTLRKAGKTFVTGKDGVNPLALILAPVIEALNAPKLQGLEKALRDVGLEVADAERTQAVWDAITVRKDAVFNGDAPAVPGSDGGIMLLLGVDGYNAWVQEFNEGSVK